MKITRASVEELIKDKGYEPIQVDGIPEGFSFKEPDILIGKTDIKGRYISFVPLRSDEQSYDKPYRITAESIPELQDLYKKYAR